MALTERQQESYTDLVDLYSVSRQSGAATDGFAKDVAPPALVASSVRALLHASPANVEPTALGRSFTDNLFTMDKLKVEASQEIEDGWYFQLKTPGHPDLNKWWAIQGGPRITPSRGDREANEAVVLCKRVPDPTETPA